jgi:hypothetical protein
MSQTKLSSGTLTVRNQCEKEQVCFVHVVAAMEEIITQKDSLFGELGFYRYDKLKQICFEFTATVYCPSNLKIRTC